MISQFPDHLTTKRSASAAHNVAEHKHPFEHPRDFLHNKFVYLVISSRAGGLSVGITLHPTAKCTFNCLYCEVDRQSPPRAPSFDIDRMGTELRDTLKMTREGKLHNLPYYATLPPDLLEVRHVALSGDGEPTLSHEFLDAVRTMVHVRAMDKFFKIVLITNSTALDQPAVLEAIKLLTRADEVWAKLDGGTQEYLNRVNGVVVPLDRILNNILLVGRRRPVVIQSLFPAINGQEPPPREIEEYAKRLKELKRAGADISLVQIYSAHRPMVQSECSHLPLKSLSQIAATVRQIAGLNVQIF